MEDTGTHGTADRSLAVEAAVVALLAAAGAAYETLRHEPVRTARQAARARGLPLAAGIKALLLKVDERFVLLALPADRTLSSRALRRSLAARRTRFAGPPELARLTGLDPGSVPPFGRPVLDLELWADPAAGRSGTVAFTPGRRDRSIVMAGEDWVRVARPRPAALTGGGGGQ